MKGNPPGRIPQNADGPAGQADEHQSTPAHGDSDNDISPAHTGPAPKPGRSPLWYLLPFGILFLALGVALYFIHPLATLLLVGSLAIQLPIILGIAKANLSSGYRDRAFARRQQYAADGDAEALLAGEAREAASVGFRYWSQGTRALCWLNQAEALADLGRGNEAAGLLAEIDEKNLDAAGRDRFARVVDTLRENGAGVTDGRPGKEQPSDEL